MKKFKSYSIQEYLDVLASKEPVPGGGSAAAVVASLGLALISMATHYSLPKAKSKSIFKGLTRILNESNKLRKRVTELIDLDAQAYLAVVKARKLSPEKKKEAKKRAAAVPRELLSLCRRGVNLTPFLVKHGNIYLLSDVAIAVEMLLAAYQSCVINVETNQ